MLTRNNIHCILDPSSGPSLMPITGGQESPQSRQHSMPGMEITPGIPQQQQQQGKMKALKIIEDILLAAIEMDIPIRHYILRGIIKFLKISMFCFITFHILYLSCPISMVIRVMPK